MFGKILLALTAASLVALPSAASAHGKGWHKKSHHGWHKQKRRHYAYYGRDYDRR